VDTHLNGPQGIAAFDALGGTNYTGGAKVPVENTLFGAGTRDSHWRESVFDHELMTGVIDAPGTGNPMSSMSIASLADLGYTVDVSQADTYNQTFSGAAALRAPQPGEVVLVDDIIFGPLRVVDRAGRVVHVLLR
jgi:hypothetical protein